MVIQSKIYLRSKNDGQVEGKVKLSNDGKFGKALEFAAGGEIKAPYIPLNEKSFTICLWVNPQLKGGDQQCVVSQTDVNALNTSLHYRIYNSGTVRMGFYGNDLDAPTAVKAGKWAHICFWLDVKKKKEESTLTASNQSKIRGERESTIQGRRVVL